MHFSSLMVRPSNSKVLPHQCVTVVYGALGPTGAAGHSGKNTGGRVWCQRMPQSGKRASGVPTVSPMVKEM